MNTNGKDYKSLIELELKGDALNIEHEYRLECASFKDESHFFCESENIRLLYSDIQSKKAEAEAFMDGLTTLDKKCIMERNINQFVARLRSESKSNIEIDDKELATILSPDLILEFKNGYSFERLETLLYGSCSINGSLLDYLSRTMLNLNQYNLNDVVKLSIMVAILLESKIKVESVAVFAACSLNKNYSTLCGESLVNILRSESFQSTVRKFALKANRGDLMIIVREFLKSLNKAYHDFILYLRRKAVQLSNFGTLTHNSEFNNAYISISVFLEKVPSARDILQSTTIPRRTVYRFISTVNASKN